MSDRRAVVVGGGLGGLAAAARLARAGWSVRLFEQNARTGGKMNRWEQGGFRFDTGPSLVTMPWVFRELFEDLGEDPDAHFELTPVLSPVRCRFDDGAVVDLDPSLPQWLETVRALEGDADGFLRWSALGARIYEISRRTFFRRPLLEPAPARETLGILRRMPLRHAWGGYGATVDRFFRSPHLRMLYKRFPTYVGSSPHGCPATLAVIPYMEQAFGAWHVRGGLYRVVEALEAVARRLGVSIETGQRVVRMLSDGRRVRGVALESGEEVPARATVMNGDASLAPVLLGERGAVPTPESERSLSGFVLLLGLKRALPDLPHHSVHFSSDYDAEFRQLFEARRFPDDPTVYVNAPCRTDPSMAPPGGEILFIMANAPAAEDAVWDAEATERAKGRVLERLRRSGFPDFLGDVEAESVWTPRRIAETYAMPGGAVYGRHSHGWRNAFLRPANRDRRRPGLYYAGGSAHPGGGTPTVLLSARIAVERIERYEEKD